ncbi:MAG TPA: hypothetical protein VM553_11555 [Dongiaceae bacterium]|nr:hypothetical protein [Dongiaceae bacterium]
MMNAELEIRCAQEIRELARQYCDGAFNKGEYRRRRRDILLRCVSEDFEPHPDTFVEEALAPTPTPKSTPELSWLGVAMAAAALLVLGIMGFLLYSIK